MDNWQVGCRCRLLHANNMHGVVAHTKVSAGELISRDIAAEAGGLEPVQDQEQLCARGALLRQIKRTPEQERAFAGHDVEPEHVCNALGARQVRRRRLASAKCERWHVRREM